MEKGRDYHQVLLSTNAIQSIAEEYRAIASEARSAHPPDAEYAKYVKNQNPDLSAATIDFGNDGWRFDTLDEFLAEYKEPFMHAYLSYSHPLFGLKLTMTGSASDEVPHRLTAWVEGRDRRQILRLSNTIDAFAAASKVPAIHKPQRVFIGHGGSSQWRQLKDHLHDLHGYDIEAYETGSRAGHQIRDIVDGMSERATFAILVMTGEDRQEDGTTRARQNVVHELGVFQGRLGFSKAVVVLEEGTQTFSNIDGVQQIRYSPGNIREVFGEVLAALKREAARPES